MPIVLPLHGAELGQGSLGLRELMEDAKGTWMIERTYSPAHFLEGDLSVSNEQYTLDAKNGKVEVWTDRDPRPELKKRLDAELRARFRAAQLVSKKPFELASPSISFHRPDGGRDIFVTAEPCVMKMSAKADVRVTDKDGNVTSDSRAERIEHKRSLGDLAAGSVDKKDVVAKGILDSFQNAIDNPDKFLVHLYEIGDALSTKFGGKKQPTTELGVSRGDWNKLGGLSNDAPLREGRHVGKKLDELRDATPDERDTAMRIAEKMVEGYLRWLDRE